METKHLVDALDELRTPAQLLIRDIVIITLLLLVVIHYLYDVFYAINNTLSICSFKRT